MVVVSNFLRFSTNSKVKTKKKKEGSSSQSFNEIQCNSTKITKKQFLLTNSMVVNINLGVLGLNLHSSNPEHVNFFAAQSSLGGARPRNAPLPWRWACSVSYAHEETCSYFSYLKISTLATCTSPILIQNFSFKF